ncbi:hypothetical protein JZ751_018043 [Albula glossodonta]|uniref:Uncharacterized protein n=1 Tax=Albula glossodonta TaxID=121402 RepID=A0A8T2PQ03_9TELE|nr:hypothetical protein JZ751_018043 [Albula glossodonta]
MRERERERERENEGGQKAKETGCTGRCSGGLSLPPPPPQQDCGSRQVRKRLAIALPPLRRPPVNPVNSRLRITALSAKTTPPSPLPANPPLPPLSKL